MNQQKKQPPDNGHQSIDLKGRGAKINLTGQIPTLDSDVSKTKLLSSHNDILTYATEKQQQGNNQINIINCDKTKQTALTDSQLIEAPHEPLLAQLKKCIRHQPRVAIQSEV